MAIAHQSTTYFHLIALKTGRRREVSIDGVKKWSRPPGLIPLSRTKKQAL
jgi:hypothetical protein